MKKKIRFIKAKNKVEIIHTRQLVQLKGGGNIKKQEPKGD